MFQSAADAFVGRALRFVGLCAAFRFVEVGNAPVEKRLRRKSCCCDAVRFRQSDRSRFFCGKSVRCLSWRLRREYAFCGRFSCPVGRGSGVGKIACLGFRRTRCGRCCAQFVDRRRCPADLEINARRFAEWHELFKRQNRRFCRFFQIAVAAFFALVLKEKNGHAERRHARGNQGCVLHGMLCRADDAHVGFRVA